MKKNQVIATLSLTNNAESLLADLERHNVKELWQPTSHIMPSVSLVVMVRYPYDSRWQPYRLPAVEHGSAAEAIRALNQLEQQARIDPDEAQQARQYLQRFASYCRGE